MDRNKLLRLREPKLASQIDGSDGGRWSARMRKAGLIEPCDHPTVIERIAGRTFPAPAYRLTERGLEAIR